MRYISPADNDAIWVELYLKSVEMEGRSMENDRREKPYGWYRKFDKKSKNRNLK